MAIINQELEKTIEKYLIMYNNITELNCFFLTSDGKIKYFQGIEYRYCNKYKELKKEKCQCTTACLYGGKQSENIGEPYIYFCPGELVNWTTAVMIKGVYVGAFVAGPVQMGISDDSIVDELMKKNEFDISTKGIFRAYMKEIPVVSPKKVRYLSDLLYMFAKDIMVGEVKILEERKKFYQQQAIINEEIQGIKRHDNEDEKRYYPVELEKELILKVKRGDRIAAKTILNELLGHILFSSGSNFEVTKARVLELMVMLSRAAVEGGGNLEKIFGMNLKYINEVTKIKNAETLSVWIIKVLERFMDSVFTVDNSGNTFVIQKATKFINENYMKNITLKDVAEYVYLNSSYFSRLFKHEVKITFKDYLNRIRVEQSKKLLVDLELSLSDIAGMVGFADQSYYTKVFKKFEGISPGQYRKLVY